MNQYDMLGQVPPPVVQGQVPCTQIGKDQNVRRMDVFFLGPLMIRQGWKQKSRSPMLGWALVAAGLGTMFYNRKNFITQQEVLSQELQRAFQDR